MGRSAHLAVRRPHPPVRPCGGGPHDHRLGVLAAFVFFAATLPNLFLSPIAGTFVDRWDHKEVLVVSDILRAAVVLLIPVAAVMNIFLVYPLIFLVDLDLDLLPPGAGRDPAADRRAR